MFDFRKAILLLAVLALGASMASAQPLSCLLNGGAPPILRAEGLAEEVGQAFISCTGGNPSQTFTINIRVFTPGFNITSRALSTGKLEAALLIDDPAPGTVNVCPGAGCNAYLADPVAGNPQAVEWTNVSFTPSTTTRVLRFVNIRVNASGQAIGFSPVPVTLQVAITGSFTLPIQQPFLQVGYVQRSMEVSYSNLAYSQCQPPSAPSTGPTVTFRELIPNAWRAAGNVSGFPQNNLLVIYNTESMYWDELPTNWPAGAGRATQATQLRITIASLPSNVTVGSIGLTVTASGGTVFSVAQTSSNTVTTLTVNTSPAPAVGVAETLTVTLPLSYPAPPALPGIGTATITAWYHPTSTVGVHGMLNPNTFALLSTPNTGLEVPRFTPGTTSADITFSPCQTRLLFPFVTSVNDGATQWDTGIAISNTSKDPWSTPAQSGACTLYFYGTPGDVTRTTSVQIGAGQQMLMTMLGGNPGQGLTPVTDFTGYMFAVCNFQYAHGYAFVSDQGAQRFAQGYIALILPSDRPISNSGRYGATPTEALNQ